MRYDPNGPEDPDLEPSEPEGPNEAPAEEPGPTPDIDIPFLATSGTETPTTPISPVS